MKLLWILYCSRWFQIGAIFSMLSLKLLMLNSKWRCEFEMAQAEFKIEFMNLKNFNSCTNSHFLWSSNSKLVHWSCPFWLLTCLLYFFPLFSLVFGSKLVSSRSNFIFFLFLTSFFLFFLGLCSNLMHFLYLVPFIFSQVFDFPFKHVWTILPSWLLSVLKFHPFYSSITPFNSR